MPRWKLVGGDDEDDSSVSSTSTVLLEQTSKRQLAIASRLAVGPNDDPHTGLRFRIVYDRPTNEYISKSRSRKTIFDPTDATKAEIYLFRRSSTQFSEAVLDQRDKRVAALERRCHRVLGTDDPRGAVLDAWMGTRAEKINFLAQKRNAAHGILELATFRAEMYNKGHYSGYPELLQPVFKTPPREPPLPNLSTFGIEPPTQFSYRSGNFLLNAPITAAFPKLTNDMAAAQVTQTEGSRRVVLWNLPYDTSTCAVLQTVASRTGLAQHERGGIVRVSLFWQPVLRDGCTYAVDYSTERLNADASRSALIEFLDAGAAKAYVDYVNQVNIRIRTKYPGCQEWTYKRVQAYLAGSQESAIAEDVQLLLYLGQTRSIVIALCPPEVVYDLLRSFGMPTITHVWYKTDTHDLTVEFVSIIDANRVWQNICRGVYAELGISGLLHPIFTMDSTERGFDAIPNGLVIEAPPNPVDEAFNKPPYNKELNVFPLYVPGQLAPDDSDDDEDHDGLRAWLNDRSSSAETRFRILGSNIVLTKKEMRWSVDVEDQIKILMANTLHDPYYQEAWDRYFELRGLINVRKCDEYAMYARERGAVCMN